MNSRRQFIKSTCTACIGLSAMGLLLQSCAGSKSVLKPVLEQDHFTVSLDQFQQGNHCIIRHKSLPFDILVVKDGTQYTALQMRCTHNDVSLNLAGKKLICTAHGSEFDLKGNVTKEPASRKLTQYKTEIREKNLIISTKEYATT